MAEYYSAELSQKVKRNMKLNAEKGLFNGGYPPLGYKSVVVQYDTYKKKRLEIDPDTAPIVKEIFKMRANDTKIMDIVDYLNSKGYKTVQGKEFKKNSLQQILQNKRYIGTNVYSDMEFPNSIPAIIDEELFNKVQEIVDKHRYAPATSKAKEEYILTTKLFCGKCKELMTGTCGTSQRGITYYYYTCNGIKKKKCNRKNISKHLIEDKVVGYCKMLLTDENIAKIAQEVYAKAKQENSQNTLIKALEKQERELNRNIENLLVAMEKGQNLDLINQRLLQNRTELDKVKILLENEKVKLNSLNEDRINFFLSQLKNGNIDNIKYRKTLINLFVNSIYLYEDELTMIFNVGKETITVTEPLLKEINTNIKKAPRFVFRQLGATTRTKSVC